MRCFLRSEKGQGLVEYALGLLGIVAVAVAVIAGLQGSIASFHGAALDYLAGLGRSGL